MSVLAVEPFLSGRDMASIVCEDSEGDLLRVAVKLNDLRKVIELLSAGENANIREPDGYEDSLLHFARSADVARVLLLRGADVNACNVNLESPLHAAVKSENSFELVKELLKFGASVNCEDCNGHTPLSRALKKKNFSSRVIRELLKYGADANISNMQWYSPFGVAGAHKNNFSDFLKCALLYNFEGNYRELFYLTGYEHNPRYNEVSQFLIDCAVEVSRMKTEVADHLSVYKLMTTKNYSVVVYPGSELMKKDFTSAYPLYHDVILDTISMHLERGELLYALRDIEVYTTCVSSEGVVETRSLNCDTVMCVAGYLTNKDISNLIAAFECSGEPCSWLSVSSAHVVENCLMRTDSDFTSERC